MSTRLFQMCDPVKINCLAGPVGKHRGLAGWTRNGPPADGAAVSAAVALSDGGRFAVIAAQTAPRLVC